MLDLIAAWNRVSDNFEARLASQRPGALDRDVGAKFPKGDSTLLGALTFLAHHESYHLGQLGLLRRLADLPSFDIRP